MILALVLAAAIPSISEPVTDLSHVLSPAAVTALNQKLREHRESCGIQLAVITVDSTDGEPIESWSLKTAVQWGGGRKRADDGGLFVLAVNDRQMRLELGYGLEPLVPDGTAASILADARSQLRERRFDQAITGVLDQLIALTATPGCRPIPPPEPQATVSLPVVAENAVDAGPTEPQRPMRAFGDGVTDGADLISAKAEQLIGWEIRQHFRETGVRLALVTIRQLDGESPDAWAARGFAQWSCHAEQPNECGLLLLVASDAEAHVSLGSKLAAQMPPELVKSALGGVRSDLDRKDFDAAALSLVRAVATNTIPPKPPPPPKPASVLWSTFAELLVWMLLVLVFAIAGSFARERGAWMSGVVVLLVAAVGVELALRLTGVSSFLSIGAVAGSIAGLRYFFKSKLATISFAAVTLLIAWLTGHADFVALMISHLAVGVVLAFIPDEKPVTLDAEGLVPPRVITYDGEKIEQMKREEALRPPPPRQSSSSSDSDWLSSGSSFSSATSSSSADSSSDFSSSRDDDYSGGGGGFGGGGASSSW